MQNRKDLLKHREEKRKKQRQSSILMMVGGALIIVLFLMLPTIQDLFKPAGEVDLPEFPEIVQVQANTMGDPNAPVVIEEYSDFACSACAYFAQNQEKAIIENYVNKGLVYFIFNSTGALLGSNLSPLAAEAAYCAGDQQEFWRYHDLIFINQSTLFRGTQTSLNKSLTKFAEELSLDITEFETCYEGNKYLSQVEQDHLNAIKRNVSATPTFFINGIYMRGAGSFDEFVKIIEQELSKSN